MVAETSCGVLGSAIGGSLVGRICERAGPAALVCGTLAGAASSIRANRRDLLALAATAAVVQIAFSSEEQSAHFLVLGEWIGRAVGTILGGYAGLKLAGSNIHLTDRITPTDSYSVNMVKFLGIGVIFDSIDVRVPVPFAAPIVKIPLHLLKSACQAAGYSSHLLAPMIRKSLRDKKLVPTLSLGLRVMCHRYCIDHSFQIANKAAQFASLKVVPAILEKSLSILKDKALVPHIAATLEFLGSHSDLIANLAMRSFQQYMDLLKRVDPNNLKTSLKKEIPGAAILSPIFDLTMKEIITGWADTLIDSIRKMEIELTGYEFQTEPERTALKYPLIIYLKYYVIFTLLNCNQFTAKLSPMEERDFFLSLNNAFFSIYTDASNANKPVNGVKKIIDLAIRAIHNLQSCLEQPEQNAGLFIAPVIIDDFYKEPDASSQEPGIFDDAVLF
jgi:hypothetical protein